VRDVVRRVAVAAAAVVLLTACSGDGSGSAAGPEPAEVVSTGSTTEDGPTTEDGSTTEDGATTETESASPTEPASPEPAEPEETLPPVRHRVSLPALMRERFRAGRIRQVRVVAETDAYTRSEVTYRSGGLTVSGILLRPRGQGPFPGVVLNHGYIDPSYYVTGQGLAREQDWLARAGFAVLHTDYRGHAASDPVPDLDREVRLGYTRDAINAVLALEREPYVDPDRMAMLGRSMGGGVTLNALVARPDLVEAAVIYASVSSRYLDNVRHFTQRSRPEAVRALYARFGTPQESPGFYRDLSSRTFFDRISDPLLIHHGTADESCPFPWATTTQRLLRQAGADSRLAVYRGEHHSFVPQWEASIRRTVAFLREHFRRG
jgi:dipeptidyl aminopeptidase/acylaminoacyl peptidase